MRGSVSSLLTPGPEPGTNRPAVTSVEQLKEIARELRVESLKMIHAAGSGHPGGSLSAAEITACLYFRVMKWTPGKPDDPNRDRFLISKGHGVPVVYAALARAGCIPREELKTLRRIDSRLQGHPDHVRLPYMEAATGSLGQGLSVALGIALAERLDAKNDYRTYCLCGDGELQAGQVWEAAMAAGKFGTNKLTAIIDYNKVQLDGHVRSIMDLEPLAGKFESFGWHVQQVDGHSVETLLDAFAKCEAETKRPNVIIADTVKGKGVSFMEDTHAWHGKAPSDEELERALAELEAA
jgi:transketolase